MLAALFALAVAGLGNVFGQRPSTASAQGDDVQVSLSAPAALRSGLVFEARLTVAAASRLAEPVVALDAGWLEGATINAMQPAPIRERSSDGWLELGFEAIPAGASFALSLALEVNPTTVGKRTWDVELRDGDRVVAAVERSVRIYP